MTQKEKRKKKNKQKEENKNEKPFKFPSNLCVNLCYFITRETKHDELRCNIFPTQLKSRKTKVFNDAERKKGEGGKQE